MIRSKPMKSNSWRCCLNDPRWCELRLREKNRTPIATPPVGLSHSVEQPYDKDAKPTDWWRNTYGKFKMRSNSTRRNTYKYHHLQETWLVSTFKRNCQWKLKCCLMLETKKILTPPRSGPRTLAIPQVAPINPLYCPRLVEIEKQFRVAQNVTRLPTYWSRGIMSPIIVFTCTTRRSNETMTMS